MNSMMRRNSSLSNQVPCALQTSTTTDEQRAKFTRCISCWHRARQVADFFQRHRLGRGHRDRDAEHGGLLFAVRNDVLQGCGVSPDSFAAWTFAEIGFPDDDGLGFGLASWAGVRGVLGTLLSICFGAAMRTEFCAQEHHAETEGRDGRQP
jgi:hypothetical protein